MSQIQMTLFEPAVKPDPTPRPIEPTEAWVVVHPIGRMFESTANEHDFLAIEAIERSLEEKWKNLKKRGYKLVKVRMEVIEE